MSGTMPAPDESSLEQKLKAAGLWLTEATAQRPVTVMATTKAHASDVRRFKLSGGRGRRELIEFCTLMTFQIKVGVTLVRALDVACQDCKSDGFRAVLRGVAGDPQAVAGVARKLSPHGLGFFQGQHVGRAGGPTAPQCSPSPSIDDRRPAVA